MLPGKRKEASMEAIITKVNNIRHYIHSQRIQKKKKKRGFKERQRLKAVSLLYMYFVNVQRENLQISLVKVLCMPRPYDVCMLCTLNPQMMMPDNKHKQTRQLSFLSVPI